MTAGRLVGWHRSLARCSGLVVTAALLASVPLGAQGASAAPTGAKPVVTESAGGDSVVVRIVDLELRTALMLLARYVDRPVIVAPSVAGGRVFLETPRP
ncbi:MAG: hypothetical protein MUE83_04185, partial [Tabrizicola sp.]|nr:hypothetical protein [Tabrizicola sp.]